MDIWCNSIIFLDDKIILVSAREKVVIRFPFSTVILHHSMLLASRNSISLRFFLLFSLLLLSLTQTRRKNAFVVLSKIKKIWISFLIILVRGMSFELKKCCCCCWDMMVYNFRILNDWGFFFLLFYLKLNSTRQHEMIFTKACGFCLIFLGL